jgi:tRNA(fMet)-specific endonuclease VapC
VIYLLDTNTLSYVVKGRSPAARERLALLGPKDVLCISAITEAEVRYGLARRPAAHALRAAMERMLLKVRVLSWGSAEAVAYGDLRAQLTAQGTVIAELDLLIAAQAKATGATLVTSDRALLQLNGLVGMENWAVDL